MLRYLLLAALLPLPACTYSADSIAADHAGAQQGAVLVELFTSQGCSSCPPADALLQKLQQNSSRVIAVSFHVDYWNNLGWKDPYSQREFSQRQRACAKALGANRIYTPQMIVNGEHAFVGSNAALARKFISRQPVQKGGASIQLSAQLHHAEPALTVSYQVQGHGAGQVLHLAVVETNAHNRVPRGENVGKELTHVNVVRVFRTVSLATNSNGAVRCELPADMKKRAVGVIAFMQDPKTWKVYAASRLSPASMRQRAAE